MKALHIIVMIGATVSQMFLRSHVGIGSSGHCLAGDFLIIVATSATVTGRKLDSGASTHLLEMVGCGKATVDCRIRSIFFSKCVAKSSAEWTVAVCGGSDSKRLKWDHSCLLSPALSLILPHQWLMNFRWYIARCRLNCDRQSDSDVGVGFRLY